MKRMHEAQQKAAKHLANIPSAKTHDEVNVHQSAAGALLADAVNDVLGDATATEKTKNEAQRQYLDSIAAATEHAETRRAELTAENETATAEKQDAENTDTKPAFAFLKAHKAHNSRFTPTK